MLTEMLNYLANLPFDIAHAIDYWVDWPVAIGLALALAIGDGIRRTRAKRRQRAASAQVTAAIDAQNRASKRLVQ